MIDVSEVITDPDFAQDFVVKRSSGAFVVGGWQENPAQSLIMSGVVTMAKENELQQVPEGDRVTSGMLFYSTEEIFTTRSGEYSGTSDRITWRDEEYRISNVWPFADYGYFKALGLSTSGD